MNTCATVSSAIDRMFERPGGLYGNFEDFPVIAHTGHARRMEILDKLQIGDPSTMTCLDFGMGGWGFGSTYPRLHKCKRAIGMDISQSALDMTVRVATENKHEYAKDFSVYQSDGMNIPLPDNSVDLVFSGESLEHTRFAPRFLSECHRVLKPGGQIVITTPNRDALLYRLTGEEYCTSPEHFWLLNYEEAVAVISEFFDIEERYGFNGTVGPELDRAFQNRTWAERWSAAFHDQPELSSSLIFRGRAKENIQYRYAIDEIPANAITLPKSPTYLPLEFGLNGVLLGPADKKVTLIRPPSDGVVCRFWSHRWSGYAEVATPRGSERVDLYSFVPGWENWVCHTKTQTPEKITISHTGEKNPLSLNHEVIFFEAFTFRKQLVAPSHGR